MRLGNNCSRGFGRVAILTRAVEAEPVSALAKRARAFDAQLKAQAGAWARHAFYLPVTLMSDAILYDDLLRHQLVLTPATLRAGAGVPAADLVYQNAGRELTPGWNRLWGLPRADEWAIAMGSVFLFGLPAEPDFAELAAWEQAGVGERRREGFGRLRVADPFHQEIKPL